MEEGGAFIAGPDATVHRTSGVSAATQAMMSTPRMRSSSATRASSGRVTVCARRVNAPGMVTSATSFSCPARNMHTRIIRNNIQPNP